MKKLLKNLFLFSLGFLLFDKLFYSIVLISPSLEVDKRLEQIINGSVNEDIVILGSSRGARDILASQVEDSLSLSTYNLSYPGSNIEFHEFLLRTLIKFNEKPKCVLLIIDEPDELIENPSIRFRYDRLYPLVRYDYINETLIEKGEHSVLSRFFTLARLNERNFKLWPKQFTEFDTIRSCGSMPVYGQSLKFRRDYSRPIDKYNVDLESRNRRDCFMKLQDLCEENRIKLALVFPPNYYHYEIMVEESLKTLSNSATYYLRYDTLDQRYKNADFYYDESHLLYMGAEVFTNELVQQMKEQMDLD